MIISGNMAGSYSQIGKTFVIVDSENNEFTGVIVDQETLFTATAADITLGKTAGTEEGVVTGTHTCP